MHAVNPGSNQPSESPEPDYYHRLNENLFNLIPTDCERVLEIGCAGGVLGEAVKKRNGGVHYTGIEMVEAAAQVAKGKLDEVHVANVESFDWSRLSGRKFDCVVFGDVLEHLVDPKQTLLAVARLLGENGSVVCCIPNVGHWSVIFGLMQGKWDYADSGLLDRTHLRFFTPRTFKKLLEECGLKPVKEDCLRIGFENPHDLAPFLRRLGVGIEEFISQATIYQFLLQAVKVPTADPSASSPPGPGDRSAAGTVEIIIPAGNEVGLTRACLDAIARCYPENLAPGVTVFDRGSTDGTQAYLEEAQQKHEWLKVIRSGSDLGFARACNKAVELSQADLVAFLSPAMEVQPGWLESMLDPIGRQGVGMVGSRIDQQGGSIRHAGVVIGGDGMPKPVRGDPGRNDPALARMREVPAVSGACALIRRGLFLSVGGFDTDYPRHYADIDMCFKVREWGLKVVYQPGSQVLHRGGPSLASLESNEADWLESRALFFGKWKQFILKEVAADPGFYEHGRDYLLG